MKSNTLIFCSILTICASLIFIVFIMSSCYQHSEDEHTKQKIAGVTTQQLDHIDIP